MSLSICQENALKDFQTFMADSDAKIFVLTGGPGRGKTFLMDKCIQHVFAETKYNVAVTATTNKAAAVLGNHVPYEVSTIHSLLSLRVSNNYKTGKQFLATTTNTETIHRHLIVMDEASMADTPLLKVLFEHTHACKFLLVGDKDQLAPIGEPLSPVFINPENLFELKTIMRQKEGSGIAKLGDQLQETVRTGKFRPIVPNGEDVIHVDGDEFRQLVNRKFTEDIPVERYKINCWRNDTVHAYNTYIRSRFGYEEHFEVGEQVVANTPCMDTGAICLNTDQFTTIQEVSPGEEYGIEGYWYTVTGGYRLFCATDNDAYKAELAKYSSTKNWKEYFKRKDFFSDLRPVHACTCWKAQGSTYEWVFIDLNDIGQCREPQTVARMLYVAVTRARSKVILYGSLPAKYNNFHHAGFDATVAAVPF